MSRVAELQKKYPNVPREMIMELDVRRNGIRYTETVDKVSYYTRGQIYASRDFDLSLKDIARERPRTVKEGLILHVPNMYTKGGFVTRVIRSTSSPYEFREESPGQYALYEGEERVDDVYFPIAPRWARDRENEPRTGKGTPVSMLVTGTNRCFGINPVLHCEYFNTGDQCKFCNFNATHQAAFDTTRPRPITIDLDEAVEAYRIVASVVPRLIEGRIIMGGFRDADKEAGIHLQFVEQIAGSTSYATHIALSTQPMSRRMMQRLKDAGLSAINMNIEVWHPELFEEVCPGKAKNRGRERYLEAYQDAVDILGWGYVGTNMPPGTTMMVENGHKTWQEARDSQVEGFRWLIGHGVVPLFETLVLGVGSVFGDNLANKEKLPPTDLYLDLALAHHDACLEYGMYEKMDKLLWCPLDCLTVGYAGQLGMVEIAGDMGKWVGRAFPDDANWLSRFIESHKETAKAE